MTVWRPAVPVTAGLAAAILTVVLADWRYAPTVGWDATAIVYRSWTWLTIWP
jgi:hypothetical protein